MFLKFALYEARTVTWLATIGSALESVCVRLYVYEASVHLRLTCECVEVNGRKNTHTDKHLTFDERELMNC